MVSPLIKDAKNHSASVQQKQLVLFDFDGTITTKDTLAEFMKFYRGNLQYNLGLAVLSPILAAYVLKIIPNWKGKQYFMSWFLKGENATEFNERCKQFAKSKVPSLVRPGALKAIEKYKREGATIAVVSASAENWVKPWCDEHKLICLATKLEVKNDTITGLIEGKNCYGPEKVCRIKDRFAIDQFDHVIAYGDTSGDKEMLALAHQQFYKPFRD